ncbi:MAG: glycogen synthase [Candidatus Omnitrophica bacterium]|nr:glycogen synthase [Candidatus Omnitrophota bacterium]
MKVAFCSSEVFPFAKTGGLADVSGALPLALKRKGIDIKVFMPLYKNIKPQKTFNEYAVTNYKDVDFFFIRNDNYFSRDGLYGTSSGDYPDNLERFSFFSKKVFQVLKEINFKPDIIHINDWQTSLISVYLKILFNEDLFFANTKSILTIHNLAYQGIFDKEKFSIIGIGWEYFNMHQLEFYDKINLLKGGIVFSDMVNTVSPEYAKQIQTEEFGCGLHGVLKEKKDRLCGILNAIDYTVWNPGTDNLIYKKYSKNTLDRKIINKKMFQKELGLKVSKEAFVLGMVSRLAEQKGIDILSLSLPYLLKKYQVVILGVGDEKYHIILKKLANKFKGSFSLNLKFDETLAHKIYASCDCFLMPSRFEPCGLSQMISYKYATIPIVHHTGGLVDTVVDVENGGGGFVFSVYSEQELIKTIDRAYNFFKDKKRWLALIKKVTDYNFSWDVAASNYIQMYDKVLHI